MIRKFQLVLPNSALLTIYQSFVRPHLECGDVIYEQAYNQPFHLRLKLFECRFIMRESLSRVRFRDST